MKLRANLDCEAVWAGAALSDAVARRVSLYASLLAAFADPADAAEIWAPAVVDPSRLCELPGWPRPTMHVGAIEAPDLSWAEPTAKAANDRRFALAVARERRAALEGARAITAASELEGELGPWVVKAPWTTAGRDRCHGVGPPTADQRTRIGRLVDRFGAVVYEPWKERVLDVGVCARIGADGTVIAEPPHGLRTDPRGLFRGIDLAPPALLTTERDQLSELVAASGAALFELGYAGPFAIDAFVYREGDARRFHPLCEINARYTFGWVARALLRRLGATRLGFDPAPPGAVTLIAPGDDGVTAWLA